MAPHTRRARIEWWGEEIGESKTQVQATVLFGIPVGLHSAVGADFRNFGLWWTAFFVRLLHYSGAR